MTRAGKELKRIHLLQIIKLAILYMGLVATKPVVGVSDKASFKPVSSSTDTS